MANPNIKFYRGIQSEVEAKNPAKGSIWFDSTTNAIKIRVEKDGSLDWEVYAGYRNVSYANNTLTFTKADGTTQSFTISGFVDFDTYNAHLTTQSEKDASQDALITANKNAIADLLGDDKNADGTPTTSVRQIVIDELANQLLEGGPEGTKAGESFETLKELAA